jgi:hypothetical protein
MVVPSFAGVDPRPLRGFMELSFVAGRTCPDWTFGFWTVGRSSLPTAMNGTAQIVLEHGWDALIVFDDDCFPPFDCVPRLLQHYDDGRLFVAGVGVMRNYPHTTTVAQTFDHPVILQHERTARVTSHQWLDDVSQLAPLASVDFCGMPVAMIARKAFDTVPPPWFGLTGPDGGTVTHDVYFCQQLKASGIPVLVDTTLKCGHLAEGPIITFDNRAHARELVGG